MIQVIGREISMEDYKSCKKELSVVLQKYGFIDDRYRGKTILEVESGGVRGIELKVNYR